MPWSRRAAPLLLLSPLLLPACAAPTPHLVRQELPLELLQCQAQPSPPTPLRDDADLAYYMLDLADAGTDCRAKLDRVRVLVGPSKAAAAF